MEPQDLEAPHFTCHLIPESPYQTFQALAQNGELFKSPLTWVGKLGLLKHS